jgi:hypothetical protein
MGNESFFTALTPIHVARGDGVHVEFINSHQVEYRSLGLTLRFDVETYVGSDGSPDGSVVEIPENLTSVEGKIVNSELLKAVIADMRSASAALRSKFHFE